MDEPRTYYAEYSMQSTVSQKERGGMRADGRERPEGGGTCIPLADHLLTLKQTGPYKASILQLKPSL